MFFSTSHMDSTSNQFEQLLAPLTNVDIEALYDYYVAPIAVENPVEESVASVSKRGRGRPPLSAEAKAANAAAKKAAKEEVARAKQK